MARTKFTLPAQGRGRGERLRLMSGGVEHFVHLPAPLSMTSYYAARWRSGIVIIYLDQINQG